MFFFFLGGGLTEFTIDGGVSLIQLSWLEDGRLTAETCRQV